MRQLPHTIKIGINKQHTTTTTRKLEVVLRIQVGFRRPLRERKMAAEIQILLVEENRINNIIMIHSPKPITASQQHNSSINPLLLEQPVEVE